VETKCLQFIRNVNTGHMYAIPIVRKGPAAGVRTSRLAGTEAGSRLGTMDINVTTPASSWTGSVVDMPIGVSWSVVVVKRAALGWMVRGKLL
jgi:hypothetical protein